MLVETQTVEISRLSIIKEQVADMAKSENITVEKLEERWESEYNKL
ncbi:hypothetical protein [Calothrix sp. CCY 0018]